MLAENRWFCHCPWAQVYLYFWDLSLRRSFRMICSVPYLYQNQCNIYVPSDRTSGPHGHVVKSIDCYTPDPSLLWFQVLPRAYVRDEPSSPVCWCQMVYPGTWVCPSKRVTLLEMTAIVLKGPKSQSKRRLPASMSVSYLHGHFLW